MGLSIEGFEDIRVHSLSPELLETIDPGTRNGRLVVPVTTVVPGRMMGVGVGRSPPEAGAWDIQSCSPELNDELELTSLRFGDLVAVEDVDSDWGHGVYEGGVIVGVVSHGASEIGGHGPGIATILSSKRGRIEPVVDNKANVAFYLGLREDLVW